MKAKKEEPSFALFVLCLFGYALFAWLILCTRFFHETSWYHYILLLPMFPIGLIMQIIPYEFIKKRLENKGVINADTIAISFWLVFLCIYGIILT